MPKGRLFGLNGRTYGTALTASLLEDKPQPIATTECEVWKMDIEHYNRTGEVRKLEHIRTERTKGFEPKFNNEGALNV